MNTISLSCCKKLFRKSFTKAEHWKHNVLHPKQFMDYFIIDVHHKTPPKTLQVIFCVFEDTTCPKILLSYTASERLGIIEFKVHNEASTSAALDAINTTKNVTFSKSLHAEKVPPHYPNKTTPKVSHKIQHIPRPLLTGLPFSNKSSPFKRPFIISRH